MWRALLALSCLCCAPGLLALHRAGEPPKAKLLTDGLATAQKSRASAPFVLSMTRLSSTPPERFTSSESLGCGAKSWTLTSSSGESIEVAPDASDRALWLLWLWSCEIYPVKVINEARGHLDPDERAIIVDGEEFAYRLGALERSHLVVDLDLKRIKALHFQPSKSSEVHRLVASWHGEASRSVTLSLSQAGKLVWTVQVEPVKTP